MLQQTSFGAKGSKNVNYSVLALDMHHQKALSRAYLCCCCGGGGVMSICMTHIYMHTHRESHLHI
jgi:hypothetical protein